MAVTCRVLGFSKQAFYKWKANPVSGSRDFTAAAPNELWITDSTEHRTDEGKLYLCAIKDVFSNRIVGYCIDSQMKAAPAIAALP